MNNTLHCPRCGEDKPEDQFHPLRSPPRKRGRQGYCIRCEKEYHKLHQFKKAEYFASLNLTIAKAPE